MNKRGFTLVELLAVLVLLGIILSITIVGISVNYKSVKDKTENIFIKTIQDAMDIYLDTDAKNLNYIKESTIVKSHGSVKLYKANQNLSFTDIINSSYRPITIDDMKNPANPDVTCNLNVKIINIYRDDDYVYYYEINKNGLGCLKDKEGFITNLPQGG